MHNLNTSSDVSTVSATTSISIGAKTTTASDSFTIHNTSVNHKVSAVPNTTVSSAVCGTEYISKASNTTTASCTTAVPNIYKVDIESMVIDSDTMGIYYSAATTPTMVIMKDSLLVDAVSYPKHLVIHSAGILQGLIPKGDVNITAGVKMAPHVSHPTAATKATTAAIVIDDSADIGYLAATTPNLDTKNIHDSGSKSK